VSKPRNPLFQVEGDSIRVSPSLAKKIGLTESMILLQLEFFLSISENERDGGLWTYQTLQDLHEQYFPFVSMSTLSRAITKLEALNLVVIGNYNKKKFDRTQWFSLNLEECGKYPEITILQNEKSNQSNCKIDVVKLQNPSSQNEKCILQNETTIPETSSEIPTETTPEKKKEANASAAGVVKKIGKLKASPEEKALIEECFEFWKVCHGKPTAILSIDSSRWNNTLVRLRDGYSVEQIKAGIRGIKHSPHHTGQNDRNTKYLDLHHVCKTGEGLEQFIELDGAKQNATSGFSQGNGNGRANGKPAPNNFKVGKPAAATDVLEVYGQGVGDARRERRETVPMLAAQDYASGVGDSSGEIQQAEVIPITSAARFTPAPGSGYRFG
jgi:hypothetical protein